MKDENGIDVCCENCRHYEYCDDKFYPDTGTTANSCGFEPSAKVYEARIQELQNENALLKDGKSHIMDVKMSPEFVKSIIRAINSEIKNLKKELRFTDKELDFIKKAISMAILDCETNPPKPSEEELKLMWSIKSKCDELLKKRANNEYKVNGDER